MIEVSDQYGREPGIRLGSVVQRSSVVDQVTGHLREAILDGTIPPGTRLRQEQVAAELGVSRTPVREAFRSLAAEGLLKFGSSTADVVALSDKDATDYYEIREVVDGLAARLAADRCTPEQLAQLKQAGQDLLAETRPFHIARWLVAHTAFHLGVLRASGNERMGQMEIVVRISSQMLYPRLGTDKKRVVDSAKEHIHILGAIESRQPEEAERLARDHIRRATQAWFRHS